MKRLLAALALFAATAANASTITTDFTDLWYAQGEDGWGVNLVQQEDTIFATLYVYDNTNTPMWYVASGVTYLGSQGGQLTFQGPLYQTTGPYFGNIAFNPANVTIAQVGTFTFTTSSVNAGRITYSVNGIVVNKDIVRQTWRNQNIAGRYIGATVGNYAGCTSGNGPYESPATYTVTQSGSTVSIVEAGGGFTCTYNGTMTQSGHMGTISGTGSCTDGFAQNFVASEVRASINSLTLRMSGTLAGGCTFDGRMGGMRRN